MYKNVINLIMIKLTVLCRLIQIYLQLLKKWKRIWWMVFSANVNADVYILFFMAALNFA